MSQLLTDPDHWRLRAQEARRSAQQLEDPEAKAAKLGMADKYDRLAARAAEWTRKTEDIPQFLKSGPTCPRLNMPRRFMGRRFPRSAVLFGRASHLCSFSPTAPHMDENNCHVDWTCGPTSSNPKLNLII